MVPITDRQLTCWDCTVRVGGAPKKGPLRNLGVTLQDHQLLHLPLNPPHFHTFKVYQWAEWTPVGLKPVQVSFPYKGPDLRMTVQKVKVIVRQ